MVADVMQGAVGEATLPFERFKQNRKSALTVRLFFQSPRRAVICSTAWSRTKSILFSVYYTKKKLKSQ